MAHKEILGRFDGGSQFDYYLTRFCKLLFPFLKQQLVLEMHKGRYHFESFLMCVEMCAYSLMQKSHLGLKYTFVFKNSC